MNSVPDMGQGTDKIVSRKEVYHQLRSEPDLTGQIELIHKLQSLLKVTDGDPIHG